MTNEDKKEESNTQPKVEKSEQVPADDKKPEPVQPVKEEDKSNPNPETDTGKEEQPEKTQREIELEEQAKQAEMDKKIAQEDLKRLKDSNRMKSLSDIGDDTSVNDIYNDGDDVGDDADNIKTDYKSKRADALADYDERIKSLDDEQFESFQKHIKASESSLLKESMNKNKYIARKSIHEMVKDGLEFIDFKSKQQQPEVDDTQEVGVPADIGSTRTIRKPLAQPNTTTDEDKSIANASGINPDRIKVLREKGYDI